MAKADLTAARLREVLQYHPDTGAFTWAASNGRRAIAGAAAGSVETRGYVCIQVDGARYKAHRLAWLYVHGRWPAGCIDHINGLKSDNRILNLRDVDVFANVQNIRTAKRDNLKTGLLGVVKVANCARWSAKINANGKRRHLGLFKSPEEAHDAYIKAKRLLHQGCTI